MNTTKVRAPACLDQVPPDMGDHPVLVENGLRLLLEAHRCVRTLQADDWEFAVEIDCLKAAGLTNTNLRWLLHRGYALQGIERTRAETRRRTFRQVANLSLSQAACFVLTDAGAAYVLGRVVQGGAETGDDECGESPVWDETRRELRVAGMVVKRFKQSAANQELVLQAFQEEGWPPRIDDPLPPEADQDPKRRLHTTISNLNRGQGSGIRVHFGGGGEGESVCWELLGALSEDRAKTERVEREEVPAHTITRIRR